MSLKTIKKNQTVLPVRGPGQQGRRVLAGRGQLVTGPLILAAQLTRLCSAQAQAGVRVLFHQDHVRVMVPAS